MDETDESSSQPVVPDRFTPCCAKCGYLLINLESDRCPECGRRFDLSDPQTHSYTDWFVPRHYWTPAVIAAAAVVLLIAPPLWAAGQTGWAVWLLVPICIGLVMQYGLGRIGFGALLATISLTSLSSLYSMGVCASIGLSWLVPLPLFLGSIAGDLLRSQLKQSTFGQAWWLPAD